jgi:hypothetical protein
MSRVRPHLSQLLAAVSSDGDSQCADENMKREQKESTFLMKTAMSFFPAKAFSLFHWTLFRINATLLRVAFLLCGRFPARRLGGIVYQLHRERETSGSYLCCRISSHTHKNKEKRRRGIMHLYMYSCCKSRITQLLFSATVVYTLLT